MPRHFRSTSSNTRSTWSRAGTVPSRVTERTYWFSTSWRPSSSWAMHIAIPSRMSTGSNPVTTIGTAYFAAIGSYSVQPITLQTCPAARKPCTRLSGESRIAVIAGGTVTWETSTLKFGTSSSRARQTAIALAGAVVSKPTAKKTTSRPGCCRAMSSASSGE